MKDMRGGFRRNQVVLKITGKSTLCLLPHAKIATKLNCFNCNLMLIIIQNVCEHNLLCLRLQNTLMKRNYFNFYCIRG
jgi:hypothetical protein